MLVLALLAVLGSDGIHSRTRQLLLGDDSLAAHSSFTHQVGYRAVLPISEAIEVLGDAKGGSDFCIHIGPNAYIPSYPVSCLFSAHVPPAGH